MTILRLHRVLRVLRGLPVLLALLALITGGAASCAVARVPPRSAPSAFGIVRADDEEVAREHARLLDEVGPFVARAVPGLEVRPVDLRIVGRVSDVFATSPPVEPAGAAFHSRRERWIELRLDLEPASRRGVLAHELVHHWLGPQWSALPPALEDGLADVVADATGAGSTARERMLSFVAAWISLNGELTVDGDARPVEGRTEPFSVTFRSDVPRLAPEEIVHVMARDHDDYFEASSSHFVVVNVLSRLALSRIPIDRLFEECLDAKAAGLARLRPERVLGAGGIEPLDRRSWNALLLESYGPDERRALREETSIPWRMARPPAGAGPRPSVHLVAEVRF